MYATAASVNAFPVAYCGALSSDVAGGGTIVLTKPPAHMISWRLWLREAGSTGAAATAPTFEERNSWTCSTILAASLLANARRYSSRRSLAAIASPRSTPCMNSRSLSCANASTLATPGGALHAGAFGLKGAKTVGLVMPGDPSAALPETVLAPSKPIAISAATDSGANRRSTG